MVQHQNESCFLPTPELSAGGTPALALMVRAGLKEAPGVSELMEGC